MLDSNLLAAIFAKLSPRRTFQGFLLVFLIIVGAFFEAISISILFPVVALILNPDNPIVDQRFFTWIESGANFLGVNIAFFTATFFCGVFFFASIYRVALIWFQVKWGNSVGHDFSLLLFRTRLNANYEHHLSTNTGDVVAAITLKINQLIGSYINPLIGIVSSSVILVAIGVVLIWLGGLLALSFFVLISSLYIGLSLIIKNKLRKVSYVLSESANQIVKQTQEAFQGIREIILNSLINQRLRNFQREDFSFRQAQTTSVVLSQTPRFLIEAILVISVVLASMIFVSQTPKFELETILPTLSVFALGIQRLMPLLQTIYANYNTMQSATGSLYHLLELTSEETPHTAKKVDGKEYDLVFRNEIRVKNICYRYPNTASKQLTDVSFVINKGSTVGFLGPTGSGKSTVLDILTGLLMPTSGHLLVDGVEIVPPLFVGWRKKVAMVSQRPFFQDDTILNNITHKVGVVDYDLLNSCLEVAQLTNTISSLPKGMETSIGEAGSSLSGGQLQRLSVARALYRQAEVLIFDEATSALDLATENNLLRAIENKFSHLTVIVVAHRTEALRMCELLYLLEEGKITRVGSFAELVEGHSSM